MKKLLDLSETCVKTLSKRAIDENTNFKLLAQAILEREATSNSFEKTAVRGTKKNKNKKKSRKAFCLKKRFVGLCGGEAPRQHPNTNQQTSPNTNTE